MTGFKLEAAFIPGAVHDGHKPVCILVDAIRASCTIVTLLEKGYQRILITDDEERSLGQCPAIAQEQYCICAEKVEGTKADAAEVSPSLEELQKAPDGHGRKVLFRTTNGTVGIRTLWEKGLQDIYIGCMLNKAAVAELAVERAMRLGTGICVVSAGRENGRIYCIDDAYASAEIIREIIACAGKLQLSVCLQDSAKIALHAAKHYDDACEAFTRSATGSIMRNANMDADIALCAQADIYKTVPVVTGMDQYGHTIVEKGRKGV